MKVGLFFGSFNPIHIGHLAIANYFVEYTSLDQLWFVVSPHNPFKKKKSLLDDYQRLEMVNIAIGKDERFRASDIEFRMPQPSYTSDTLVYLKEKFPKNEFVLIMGSDGIAKFHEWKNSDIIRENHLRLVYPRPGYEVSVGDVNMENAELVDAPNIEISSTFIRDSVKQNKDIRYFLPHNVFKYIDEMSFYRN